jgi:hypothetical protein
MGFTGSENNDQRHKVNLHQNFQHLTMESNFSFPRNDLFAYSNVWLLPRQFSVNSKFFTHQRGNLCKYSLSSRRNIFWFDHLHISVNLRCLTTSKTISWSFINSSHAYCVWLILIQILCHSLSIIHF